MNSLLVASFLMQSEPILPSPVLRPVRAPQVQLVGEKVSVRIVEGAATTELEQSFFNPSGAPAEETFLFPIPPDTVVTDLTLTMDGKPVKGEVLDKDKARQIYNQIVMQRRDPAILEYAGYGLIRASIFPVPPQGEAKVAMKYTTILRPTGGLYDYNFPLRIAGLSTQALRSLVFDVQIESSKPIQSLFSPSHKIDIVRDGDRKARLSLEGRASAANSDFRLVYGISEAEFGLNCLTFRKGSSDGYFLLFLAPKNDIPAGKVQSKDIIFVVDTSGSMAGEKMKQAKEALKFCLNRLNKTDRFNLIRFSTEAAKFKDAAVEANPENISQGLTFIDQLEARGGTNINEAMEKALESRSDANRLFMVCFLTDGLPTVGVTDVDQIIGNVRAKNSAGTRVFTFGVGDDVNTRLLDTIAEETRAARSYVRPNENIEVAVSSFYDQVSTPVLTNPSITAEGIEILDIYPKRVPDLFKGSQVILAGRFRGEGKRKIHLAGIVMEEKREWIYEADFSGADSRNDFIAPLWASRKVGYLLDEMRLHGSNPELVAEVTRLGKEYGIVTPFTSHLVVEEQMRVADNLRRSRNDLNVPLGAPAAPAAELAESERKLEGLKKDKSSEAGKDAVDMSVYFARAAVGGVASGGAGSEANWAPKRVGEKLFFKIGEYWVDQSLKQADLEKTTKIGFLGEEYFKLLESQPEIERVLSLGQKILVEWKGLIYEIS